MADRSTEEKALTFSDKLKLVYNHTLWTDYIKKGKIKEGTILDKITEDVVFFGEYKNHYNDKTILKYAKYKTSNNNELSNICFIPIGNINLNKVNIKGLDLLLDDVFLFKQTLNTYINYLNEVGLLPVIITDDNYFDFNNYNIKGLVYTDKTKVKFNDNYLTFHLDSGKFILQTNFNVHNLNVNLITNPKEEDNKNLELTISKIFEFINLNSKKTDDYQIAYSEINNDIITDTSYFLKYNFNDVLKLKEESFINYEYGDSVVNLKSFVKVDEITLDKYNLILNLTNFTNINSVTNKLNEYLTEKKDSNINLCLLLNKDIDQVSERVYDRANIILMTKRINKTNFNEIYSLLNTNTSIQGTLINSVKINDIINQFYGINDLVVFNLFRKENKYFLNIKNDNPYDKNIVFKVSSEKFNKLYNIKVFKKSTYILELDNNNIVVNYLGVDNQMVEEKLEENILEKNNETSLRDVILSTDEKDFNNFSDKKLINENNSKELVEETIKEITEETTKEITEETTDKMEEILEEVKEYNLENLEKYSTGNQKEVINPVYNLELITKTKSEFKYILLKLLILILVNLSFLVLNYFLDPNFYEIEITILLLVSINILLLVLLKKNKNLDKPIIKENEVSKFYQDMEFAESINEEYFNLEEETSLVPETVFLESDIFLTRPKEVVRVKYNYDLDVDLEKYVNNLNKYLKDFGLENDIRTNREFFSSMACSKVINLKNADNYEISFNYIKILSEFIGAKLFYTNDDFKAGSTDNNIINCLNEANANKNIIHFLVVNNKLATSSDNFNNIFNYSKYFSSNKITLDYNDYEISENVWFIILDQENNIITNHLASDIITLNAKFIEPKETVKENERKLSYYNFNSFVLKNEERYYLSNNVWKKLDKLEEFVNKQGKKLFTNLLERKLENYITVFLLANGLEIEALDSYFASKILYIAKELDLDVDHESKQKFFSLYSRLFEDEILTKSNLTNILLETSLIEGESDDSIN